MSASSDQGRGLAHGVVGPARVISFGVSSVAPAGSVVAGLVILVSYAGFASPLVVLVAFIASLCCANSIAEFARRLPSAGSLYTYNSRGLGTTGGFLTGWMMIAAYALYVPAGVALTSTYASMLLANVLHMTIAPWVLFLVILAAVAVVAYLGIATSSSVDLLLAAGEIAVIAALAITILVKIGPAHYSAGVLSPASSPHGQLSDITNAMIYGISAFAGFEAAAALGEEARDSRRSIPAGTIVVVIVTGIFYLLVVLAETFGAGPHGIAGLIRQPSPLGYLTSRYWSSSVLWAIDLVVVLTGLGFVVAVFNAAIRILFAMGREQVLPGSLARLSGRHTPVIAISCATVLTLVLGLPLTYADGGPATFRYLAGAAALSLVLIYLAVNIATIRAFRTEFRDQSRLWRHLVLPAAAAVLFLFPLWGILHPRAYTLVNLLPFLALGWLCVGVIAAGFLRAKRPAGLEAVGRVFAPAEEQPADAHLYEPTPPPSSFPLHPLAGEARHAWGFHNEVVTEYSRAPVEPNSAQPGSAGEGSTFSRDEQAELERLRIETAWTGNQVSTGPVGQWTYMHRKLLRVAAVALAALILVYWGQPTGLVVIVLVVILLVLLGLIELIGRPPAPAAPV